MLCQAASQWSIRTSVIDKSRDFPAASVTNLFVEGNFKDEENVYQFGLDADILTIEIETINVEALERLQMLGKIVHPDPSAIRIIRDKSLQKKFFLRHGLPTTPFQSYQSSADILLAIERGEISIPFVQKASREGYDGRGVALIRSTVDLDKLMDVNSIIEDLVDIEKEIGVIVGRNNSGEVKSFPPVAMKFHPTANLVEFLSCPAEIDTLYERKAVQIARSTIEAFGISGLLAVEMFLTTEGKLLINEVAPRPHNSGHHTIESCNISQYQQHLLAICDLPLVDVKRRSPSVMVNLLGKEGYSGPVIYRGVDACLKEGGVHIHLYGKMETRPFRKMGHATILAPDLQQAMEKATFVKEKLEIIS
jgi:5-(carboxyamino)imidazole ribonucleotide synthase